ncbi:MAG: AAA family ATPase [Polyangiaceae bacterium]|nr:AAA family ATPase [Polyangiaceae bacterium]
MPHDVLLQDDRARRFLFRRRIGEGAFGVVWEAYDTERGARVALKALTRTEPASLYLFKREFRALADIVHPNLVTLYELLSFGEKWFFTMELVEGSDFVDYVRGTVNDGRRSAGTDTVTILRSGPVDRARIPSELTPEDLSSGVSVHVGEHRWYEQPTLELSTLGGDSAPSVPVRISVVDSGGAWSAEKGPSALLQLAEGLSALHEAGKLHRDIKPSNVLVTPDGRVVILDFGLITELWPTGVHRETHAVVGTPAFMSPEQSLGRPLTPASDWYSVGVMLYVALTGKLPFDGPPLQVLLSKQRLDPPHPSTVADGVPPYLESLCLALLQRRPEDRPTGAEVLRTLGGGQRDGVPRARATGVPRRFVGRETQLKSLNEMLRVTQEGRPAAVVLSGPSGIGKTALTQAFIRQIRKADQEALILTGRCYPRESVPYKAVDNVVDELSIHLQLMPNTRSAVLLPRGADALLRMFPVLRQIESAAPVSLRGAQITSETELRRRAFGALRELFGRIAERRQLVLMLDDLQWSDADSDALLASILRAPDAPPLLLVASYRAESMSAAPLLKTLAAEGIETLRIELGPMSIDEAAQFAEDCVGENPALVKAIARESGGNPFFVEALADHAALNAVDDSSLDTLAAVDLGEMFKFKIAELPQTARTLLETIAVAGHPIAVGVAWRASDIVLPEQSMLSLLGVRKLVRSTTDVSTSHEELEPYHDRVRDVVIGAMLPAAVQKRHERIAQVLEAAGQSDPEVLASHYEAAGRFLDAGRFARLAADQSTAALAFDRAARLYRWALSLAPASDDSETRQRLGDALTNAGRGAEAAEAYLAAARGAPSSRVLELRRKAAEQLLISGHIDRGMEIIRLLLGSLGTRLPQSQNAAIVSFVASRARLKLRGLDFTERAAHEIPPDELLKIDAIWAVSIGLSLVDSVRGTDYQSRHLLLALDAGEPYRVARALALEAVFSAAGGPKAAARSADVVERSLELAERIHHPHALGLSTTMAGAARYLSGRWRDGLELLERGSRILREQCTGVTWERDTADIFYFTALMQLGRWKELAERYDDFVRDAHARGDLYAEQHAQLELGWYVHIARDEPEAARALLTSAHARKTGKTFDLHDVLFMAGSTAIDLYCGRPTNALRSVEQAWGRLRAGLFLEIYLVRIESSCTRARAFIACAAEPGASQRDRAAWLKGAQKDITRIEADKAHHYPAAYSAMLRSGVASVEGDRVLAQHFMEEAERAYCAADMEVHIAVARIRLGQLVGGERGKSLIEEGRTRLLSHGILSPERISRMIAPGRFEK